MALSYKYIRWVYENSASVKLEASDTGGAPWQEVIACEEDGDLSYLWPAIRKVMKQHCEKTLDDIGTVMTA